MQKNIAIYIDPPTHHFLQNRLFDTASHQRIGDNLNAPYVAFHQYFEAQGIPVNTIDYLPEPSVDTDIIYIAFSNLANYKKMAQRKDILLSTYVAMECPVVEPSLFTRLKKAHHYFKHILSWSDGESLAPYIGETINVEPFKWPQAYEAVHEEFWCNRNRKFMVMLNSNKLPRIYTNELYTERMRAVVFFSRTGDIDLYGHEWDLPSHKLGIGWIPYTFRYSYRMLLHHWHKIRPNPLLVAARKVYKGVAASKEETLSQYNFSICFENMILNGWITEKIFDCFYSGTVPIYRGAPDIEEFIPANCYIDMRNFPSYCELLNHLKSLNETDIQQYRDNAKAFLASDKFSPFDKDTFVDIFKRIITADTGIQLD